MANSLRGRWIAALRSGDYKQGRGTLRDGANNMCCMGVLCHIVDPQRWNVATLERGEKPYFTWMGASAFPPSLLLSPITAEVLAKLNDEDSLSFGQIADYLEEHPEITPTWNRNGR